MGINNKALILIGMLSILLVFGVVGFGQTDSELLIVDGSDDSDCDDNNGEPYCTIRAAIDAANGGTLEFDEAGNMIGAEPRDTILVKSGSYDEKLIIQLDKPPPLEEYLSLDDGEGQLYLKNHGPLTLRSANPGDTEIIHNVGIHIRPQASGSTVEGFNIFPEDAEEPEISGTAGLGYIDMDGAEGINFTHIHANDISYYPFGIGVLGGNYNVFGSVQHVTENGGAYEDDDGKEYDNYIHNNFAGIAAAGVEGGSAFGDGVSTIVGNYIGRNYIEHNYVGIGLIGAEDTTIEENKIEGGPAGRSPDIWNIIGTDSLKSSLLGIGIVGIEEFSIAEDTLEDTLLVVPANNNTIVGNNITENAGMGILLLGSGENDIGLDATLDTTNEEINGNTITNNGTAGLGIIGVDNFSIDISYTENPEGDDVDSLPSSLISVKLPANNNDILGNEITNNDEMGILFVGSGDNQIGGASSNQKNTITGNGLGGIGVIGIDEISIDGTELVKTIINATAPEDAVIPEEVKLSVQLPANDNDILGNEINNNNGMGIWLLGSGENAIEGNEITGNGSAGISVAGIDEISVDITELVWNIIKSIEGDLTDDDIKDNITSPGVINLSTNNNDILGNDITDNDGMGIWLLGSGENDIGWDDSNQAIKGNTITGNELAGIGIVGVDEISVDAIGFVESIKFAIDQEFDLPEDLVLPESLPASITLSSINNRVVGNTIKDNGAFGVGLLGSSGNKIRNNEAIDDNFIGIGALGVNKLSHLKQILEEAQPSIPLDELGDSFVDSFGPLTSFFESFFSLPDQSLSSLDEVLGSLEIPGVTDLIDAGLDDEPFTCESHDNIISHNYIRGNEAVGIGLLNSNENVIEYNNITNTTKGGNLSGKLLGFKDKDIPGTGIVISDADSNEIRYNVIRDNEVGVYLAENLIEDYYFENPGTPEGNSAHYNSIAENENHGVLNETTETFNATLNWWGDHSGPSHPTENPDGTGNKVSDNVIFSPWIGMNPDENPNTVGVQLKSPLTLVVDDVGPTPNGGYLNTAIKAANSDQLPGSDTIEVHNGDYTTSSDQPVTESVTIVSCMGCPMDASIDGELSITAENIQIGGFDNYTAKGFNIDGDVRVEGDVDASEVHINWNNISGTVTNEANGTLDATYNWWGDPDGPTADGAAGSMEGDVDYTPFLSMKVCALMEYMKEHNIDDPKDAVAGMVTEDLTPCELTIAQLTGMGFSPDEAEELCDDYGCGRVMNAVEQADTSGEFVELLGGYSLPAGAAGGLTNNTVAGGAGSIGGKTVGSVFEVCDLIKINFALADFKGDPAKNLTPTVSLVKLDDDGEKESLERVTTASYKDPEEAYQATFSSCELPPGYYQAQVDLRDGSSLSQVIKIESDRAEKVEEA